MLYRNYGQTGKKVSLLGFGGMRFGNIDNHEECIRMMVRAAEGGVNYFDTAPLYFATKSETIFGEGLAELRRRNLPYYVATKTFKTTETEIRQEIEAQLKRLNVSCIDFYHIWCIHSPEDWQKRKRDGIVEAFRKLKDEGIIKHICVSSHLVRDQIKELLQEKIFEGVLFGYSAYNFKTREQAFDAIRTNKLGAVLMNPLGGGVIPQHPELFDFIRRGDEPVIHAALHFLWDHKDISTTLVGFNTEDQVADTLRAMEDYKPRTEAELEETKKRATNLFEGICTGCGYCDECPQNIPIPQFMDSYNQKILSDIPGVDVISRRLNNYWHIDPKKAADCVGCGQCESACTQHINIIERLKETAQRAAAL